MAEGKEIVIRIVNDGGGSSSSRVFQQQTADVTGEKIEKSTDMISSAFLASIIQRGKNQLKSVAINEVEYQINKHFQLTDDYLGQQNLNIALGIVQKAGTVIVSAYEGFKVGGVYGAVIAAAATGFYTLVSVSQQISHNYEQERIKINQMNANLSFNRQKAGYALTAGSIGENR